MVEILPVKSYHKTSNPKHGMAGLLSTTACSAPISPLSAVSAALSAKTISRPLPHEKMESALPSMPTSNHPIKHDTKVLSLSTYGEVSGGAPVKTPSGAGPVPPVVVSGAANPPAASTVLTLSSSKVDMAPNTSSIAPRSSLVHPAHVPPNVVVEISANTTIGLALLPPVAGTVPPSVNATTNTVALKKPKNKKVIDLLTEEVTEKESCESCEKDSELAVEQSSKNPLFLHTQHEGAPPPETHNPDQERVHGDNCRYTTCVVHCTWNSW